MDRESLLLRTGFFEIDEKGRFLWANLSALEMFGYTREDLKQGLTIFDIVAEKHQKLAYESIKKALAGELTQPNYYLARRKDGSNLKVLVDVSPFEKENVFTLRGLVINLESSVEGNLLLQQSNLFYRQVVEKTPVAVYKTHINGQILFANDAFLRILGFSSREELLQRTVPSLYHNPEERKKLLEILRQKGQVEDFQTELVRKDGKVIRISLFALLEGEIICGTFLDITTAYQEHQQLIEKTISQKQLIKDIIYALNKTLSARDYYTANHQLRVTELACLIAEKMGFTEEKVQPVYYAGLVHDVGKIGIPLSVLVKKSELTTQELTLVRTHPVVSQRILSEIHFPWPIAEIVAQHHERLDGTGYPRGLKGPQIVLEARILAVADVVEAMSSRRPYREAQRPEETLKEITANRGYKFDPEAVDACVSIINQGLFSLEKNGAGG